MATSLREIIDMVDELSSDDKQQLLEYLQAEAAYEAELIEKAVGEHISPDGTIDFDAIYSKGKTSQQLHSEYPDLIDKDGHMKI